MKHDQDELLLLYYYRDGLNQAERQNIANALANNPCLAERYDQISKALAKFGAGPPAPLSDDRLQRFHDTIDRAANRERAEYAAAPVRPHFWSFLLGACASAAIVVGLGLGGWFSGDVPGTTLPVVADVAPLVQPSPAANPDALRRGIQVYFRESTADLGNYSAQAEADRFAMLMGLIEQNRRFEKLAMQNQSPGLARVLRAFEPILVRLAAADISPEESEKLRSKLAFELNVMLTKLTQPASDEAHALEQET